jgi:indole-3-glycerol phosphate synthase
VQDTQIWSPPSGTLARIISEAELRVGVLLRKGDELAERASAAALPDPSRSLASAISRSGPVAIIAEIKRKSPSKGEINRAIEAPRQARDYVAGGAAAISVLTEPVHFGGSTDDLRSVSQSVLVPVLRKDFIVHRVQLLEALIYGASAVLLIARALPPEQLLELADEARKLGLEVLLEVRSVRELQNALLVPRAVVGVNNRNLETLEIDPSVSQLLIPQVPGGRLAVYESGVASRADVERAAAMGADAVLAGSVLSASSEPRAAVAAIASVAKTSRASGS